MFARSYPIPSRLTGTDDPSESSTEVRRDDLGPLNITYFTANSGVFGYYVDDTLSTGGVSVITTVGVATEAHSGDPAGGIMGIGLPGDEASVSASGQEYPGLIRSLVDQGIIAVPAFSIYLDPSMLFFFQICYVCTITQL